MNVPKVLAPIKCGNCGEVTIFEVVAPVAGSKSFSFDCPNGHAVSGPNGHYVVVDLKDYDESKLKRVVV